MLKGLVIAFSLMSSVCFADNGWVSEIKVVNTALDGTQRTDAGVMIKHQGRNYSFCGSVTPGYIERAVSLMTAAMIAEKQVDITVATGTVNCIYAVSVNKNN